MFAIKGQVVFPLEEMPCSREFEKMLPLPQLTDCALCEVGHRYHVGLHRVIAGQACLLSFGWFGQQNSLGAPTVYSGSEQGWVCEVWGTWRVDGYVHEGSVGHMRGGWGTWGMGGAHEGWVGHMRSGWGTWRVDGYVHEGWVGHMRDGGGTHSTWEGWGGGKRHMKDGVVYGVQLLSYLQRVSWLVNSELVLHCRLQVCTVHIQQRLNMTPYPWVWPPLPFRSNTSTQDCAHQNQQVTNLW